MGQPVSLSKIRQEERRGGVKGGLIVRKMNGGIGTGDTLGQTLMDSIPVGDCRQQKLSGSDLGLAVTRNSVISHAHAHTHSHKYTTPICLILCLPLTQYYPAHHSSRVILLRDTNWTPSQHDCQATWVIFHPSLHHRVREKGGGMKKDNGNLSEVSLLLKQGCSSPGSFSFLCSPDLPAGLWCP